MNVTGLWKYIEDFEFGNSVGEVRLVQMEDTLYGEFNFTEKVEDDYEIIVFEKVKGKIIEGKAILESVEVIAKENDRVVDDYIPNNFELHLISKDKLVGSSYDTENVCGVFTLERLGQIYIYKLLDQMPKKNYTQPWRNVIQKYFIKKKLKYFLND